VLKQISATVVALSFLLSPALAKTAKKPDAPVCATPEQFIKAGKPRYTLAGDDLARFKAKLAEAGNKFPIPETDLVLIAGGDNSPVLLGVMFVKGCAKGMFVMPVKLAEKATAPAETL
jgi:hypothetical protein